MTAVKKRHTLLCCVSFVPCPITSPPEGDLVETTRYDSPGVGVGRQPEEPRNTRPTTTPSSCRATTMTAASEVCLVVISQDTSCKTVFFSSCLFWNLSDGEASFGPLDDNGGGADCVSSFYEAVQMLSCAGVDGALERDCLHDR